MDEPAVKISDEEWNAAEDQAKKSQDVYTLTFKRPWEYEGTTYKELTFDWGSLTGEDSMSIETELRMRNIPLLSPAFSGDYIIRAASRACTSEHVGIDVLKALPIGAFLKIRSACSAFLLHSEI